MPSQSSQVRPTPTRAPIASLEPRLRPSARSNASEAARAGLAVQPAAAAGPAVEQPSTMDAAVAASATTTTALQAPSEGGAAPAAPAADHQVPDQAAPSGALSGVAARVRAGELEPAANELRQIVSTQRKLLSGGGDRALLQAALAALAVTDALVAAQKSKESGKLAEATRQAQTAGGTLGRAPMLDGDLRDALASAVSGFGARSVGPEAAPQDVGASAEGYDAALGQALARASAGISGGNPRAGGRCYARVADAVDAVIGRFLSGGHAYMAASQLAARKNLFTETSAADLSSLPAGAIVVWGKGSSPSGHISIALGDGRESSDFVGPQMTRHYGGASARVFLPKARMAK